MRRCQKCKNARTKRWQQSAKGISWRKAYTKTAKGKAVSQAWHLTEKGQRHCLIYRRRRFLTFKKELLLRLTRGDNAGTIRAWAGSRFPYWVDAELEARTH